MMQVIAALSAVNPFAPPPALDNLREPRGGQHVAPPSQAGTPETEIDPAVMLAARCFTVGYLTGLGALEISEAGADLQSALEASDQTLLSPNRPRPEQPVATGKQRKTIDIPASTVEAFRHVVRKNNPEQLRAWLSRRSAEERRAFRKMLAAK